MVDAKSPAWYRKLRLRQHPLKSRGLEEVLRRKKKIVESQSFDPSHVFWPQDLLSQDCAAARILTFGYNSDVSKFFDGAVNRNNFYDHANDLLRALLRERLGAAKVSKKP